MDADRLQLGQCFMVRWVIVSGIGLMAGFIVYFMSVVSLTAESGFILRTLVSAGSGAILGAAVGGAIGSIVAFPVANAVGDAMGFNMAVFAGSIVLGLPLGTAQVVILREHLSVGGWWVLAHAAGIPFGWALGRGLGESIYNLVAGGVG